MKKLLFIITACTMLMLCACSSDTNTESVKNLNNEETMETTENIEAQEVITEEEIELVESTKPLSPPEQTPGNETYDISADDIWLYTCTGTNIDPIYEEITDTDVKVKIYNMVRNAVECEEIDYDQYERWYGCTSYRAKLVLSNGECYRIYLGGAGSDHENFTVYGTREGSYRLNAEFMNEFYDLLGIQRSTTASEE
ncbi:MAG: hypothetical protein LUC25_02625 [Ruminococcus sp.]|nr:hypothetical protein [Ruminococcus sp.]